jgi:release factor glutamine methyltransferase
LRDIHDILKNKLKNESLDLNSSTYLSSTQLTSVIQKSLLCGHPLAYLMGFSEFYYHRFFVNQHVLVPRPETEWLVDLIKQENQIAIENVLDVGVGSGVILLSLISHGVGKSGIGVDISEDALEVARINCFRLRLESKVQFICSDRLSKVPGVFDLIVSNPPYIKASSHRSLVHESVDLHEPPMALYLEDDVYERWFEEFFISIRHHLNGVFWMEGHELEVENQSKQLMSLGFNDVTIFNDLAGRPRYIKAKSCVR